MEYVVMIIGGITGFVALGIVFSVQSENDDLKAQRNELERENARLSGVIERMRKEEKQRKIDMEV